MTFNNLQLFHECALDMRWQIANEARNAELAIIISYPTSANGIIVLSKTLTKYREFLPTLFVKTTDFQFRRVQSPYLERWYHGSYAMMAKPIRALELHYPMIQFLIIQAIARKREGNQEALGTRLRKLS